MEFQERIKQLKSDIETFLHDFDIKEIRIESEPELSTEKKVLSWETKIEIKL